MHEIDSCHALSFFLSCCYGSGEIRIQKERGGGEEKRRGMRIIEKKNENDAKSNVQDTDGNICKRKKTYDERYHIYNVGFHLHLLYFDFSNYGKVVCICGCVNYVE